MFAVANREIITVSFDPFDSASPALAFKMPLFILIFVLVGLGVLVGGIAAWLRQHKWRARARRAEADVRAAAHRARRRSARCAAAPPPREAQPPLIVPPAA